MTDKDLVRSYQKGNESAFTELLNRHKEKIFSTIFYLVHNRKEKPRYHKSFPDVDVYPWSEFVFR